MTVLTFSSIKSTSINENRNQTSKSDSYFYLLFLSGETGIRTLGTVTRSPHFECGPIDHSGISPKRLKRLLKIQKALYRAGRQGFEPRVPRGTTVFKTAGTSRYNGFQDRRNRPLCHLSKLLCQVLLFFKSAAKVRIIFEYASVRAKKVRRRGKFANICLSLPRYYLIKRRK